MMGPIGTSRGLSRDIHLIMEMVAVVVVALVVVV